MTPSRRWVPGRWVPETRRERVTDERFVFWCSDISTWTVSRSHQSRTPKIKNYSSTLTASPFLLLLNLSDKAMIGDSTRSRSSDITYLPMHRFVKCIACYQAHSAPVVSLKKCAQTGQIAQVMYSRSPLINYAIFVWTWSESRECIRASSLQHFFMKSYPGTDVSHPVSIDLWNMYIVVTSLGHTLECRV
jgi:hypothetical protein